MTDQLLRLTVRDGLAGVNRVVGLLRHRGTKPQAITARVTSKTDTWVVEHRLIATEEQTALIHRQLERLPTVTAVQHGPALTASTREHWR